MLKLKAICLGLEGCKGAWARAREELLRVGAQGGGAVDHADKTSLNTSKVTGQQEQQPASVLFPSMSILHMKTMTG